MTVLHVCTSQRQPHSIDRSGAGGLPSVDSSVPCVLLRILPGATAQAKYPSWPVAWQAEARNPQVDRRQQPPVRKRDDADGDCTAFCSAMEYVHNKAGAQNYKLAPSATLNALKCCHRASYY